jgi:hypothetical protein
MYIKYFNHFVYIYIFMIVPKSFIIYYREHRMKYGDLKNSFETYFVTGVFKGRRFNMLLIDIITIIMLQ